MPAHIPLEDAYLIGPWACLKKGQQISRWSKDLPAPLRFFLSTPVSTKIRRQPVGSITVKLGARTTANDKTWSENAALARRHCEVYRDFRCFAKDETVATAAQQTCRRGQYILARRQKSLLCFLLGGLKGSSIQLPCSDSSSASGEQKDWAPCCRCTVLRATAIHPQERLAS